MPIWLRNFTHKKLIEHFKPKDDGEKTWNDKSVMEEGKKSKKIKPPSYITNIKPRK